jgi:hypothetical protein
LPVGSARKAAIAVGHSILVIAWHLLTDSCDYQDLGGDYFIRRDTIASGNGPSPSFKPSATVSSSNPWRRNTPGIHVSG